MNNILDGLSNKLSISDKDFVKKINNNPEVYINLSINELGNLIGASNSTVSKFVRRIGFRDYRSFQSYLTKTFHLRNESTLFNVKEDDKKIVSLKNYNFYVLNETTRKMNLHEIERFSKTLIQTRRIWCIGTGNSYLAARDFSDSLNLLDFVSFSTNDVYGNLPKFKALMKDDIVIFFSELFAQADYHKLLNIIKSNSVKVCVITSINEFFIDKRIDFLINFFAFPKMERPKLVKNSKIQQIFLNNYIITNLIEILDNQSK
ncbi:MULTISPECIES: MurR/RpiR family transcriptional regulator [Mesoplasma]|uniref:MurR/RpiR family transcriptional regulator n=1 Tax=Mesoplasma florum TaxID=2151 RepID=A0A2R3P7D2_MESFO|nr:MULTISPECIES: MurR/RpiR family transcriptional regulator [Mesoplasma]AVN64371.1 MurR/RpiR family transcriptional regulator [Mesoplasma florum]